VKLKTSRSISWNLEYATMNITQIITDGADCYPWTETFVIFPKKTITGKRLAWQKLYKRRVWVVWGTGFHMEPETQYATLFEILDHGHNKN
jgi:hypothetical protein